MSNNLALSANTIERLTKERASLFANPKTYKEQIRLNSLLNVNSPIINPPEPIYVVLPTGEKIETEESVRIQNAYNSLIAEGKEIITHWDLILRGQTHLAYSNTQSATFIRDTIGLKPIDETKVQQEFVNPYDNMTDDELEALATYRKNKNIEVTGSLVDTSNEASL